MKKKQKKKKKKKKKKRKKKQKKRFFFSFHTRAERTKRSQSGVRYRVFLSKTAREPGKTREEEEEEEDEEGFLSVSL